MEHLPVLVMPRWVSMPAQPIGIDDLLAYLLEALHAEPTGNPIYEIGGADRMSYADLMREYARRRGLRRVMLVITSYSIHYTKLYDDYVVQDIRIESHNIQYRIERWLTPGGDYIQGKLPSEISSTHFGPALISYILQQYSYNFV